MPVKLMLTAITEDGSCCLISEMCKITILPATVCARVHCTT